MPTTEGDEYSDAVPIERGDAYELLAGLNSDSAHAAVLDFPWQPRIKRGSGRDEYRGNGGRTPSTDYWKPGMAGDMYEMEPDERFGLVVDELARVLQSGSWLICFADDRFQDTVRSALQSHDQFIFRRNWAWTPESMGMGHYGRVSHYPIPVATLGETGRYVQDRGTLYSIGGGRGTEYPTGKPVDLYRQLLAEPVLTDGERLLEPFCGSAPGAAIANERGLRYWGCDLNPEAIKLAKKRVEQTTLFRTESGENAEPYTTDN